MSSEPIRSSRLTLESETLILTIAFFTIAFVYSSVGLGGGSSYTALMSILGIGHVLIPTISLSLNTIVASLASWQYARNGHFKFSVLWPFLVSSIPMALLGGRLELGETVFQILLLISLVAVAVRIYFWRDPAFKAERSQAIQLILSLCIGAVLGFIAGTVGIGGGIYLVPIILILGIAETKEAAAAGAVFIVVNSVVGLAARVGVEDIPWEMVWPLAIAVLVGGLLGSRLGAGKWKPRTLQKILGSIILLAIVLLINKLAF